MAPFMWTKCPECTEGRKKEERYRIQETNRRIFYWSRQPTGATTEKKNGEKEEPKRPRKNEDNGGDAKEPEPKRQRIANFDNSGVEKSNPSTSGTIPPNVEE
jgi:hypothetical protein